MKPGLTGITRIFAATRNSFRGIRDAWQHEAAFRQDVSLCVILLVLSFWLAQSLLEWLVLILPLFLLIIVEIINSAIENTIDRLGSERHVLSGRAKDMGSAAVFVSLVLVLLVWGTVACQRFWA